MKSNSLILVGCNRKMANKYAKDKRAYDRIQTHIDTRFFYGNMFYTGIITNISEKGMIISTEIGFPVKSEFNVLIKLQDKLLKVPVKIVRTVKLCDPCKGMVVNILNTSKNYLEFLKKLNPATPK